VQVARLSFGAPCLPTSAPAVRIDDPVHAVRDRSQPWRAWYKTARWQRLRWQCLVRDLFTCRMCGWLGGNDTSQLVADHVRPHRGRAADFWDLGNLQCLCKACHDGAKQRVERAGR